MKTIIIALKSTLTYQSIVIKKPLQPKTNICTFRDVNHARSCFKYLSFSNKVFLKIKFLKKKKKKKNAMLGWGFGRLLAFHAMLMGH